MISICLERDTVLLEILLRINKVSALGTHL